MASKSSRSESERSPLRDLLERGEEVVNVFLEELTGGANLRDELESAVDRANRARKSVDKNMEAVLSALNLPTRRDYKRLVDELHSLQGAVVNLNMKLDRLIAQTAASADTASKPATKTTRLKPRAGKKMGRGKPRIRATRPRKRAASE